VNALLVEEDVRRGVVVDVIILREEARGEAPVAEDDDDKMFVPVVSKSEPQTDMREEAVSMLRLRRADRGWDIIFILSLSKVWFLLNLFLIKGNRKGEHSCSKFEICHADFNETRKIDAVPIKLYFLKKIMMMLTTYTLREPYLLEEWLLLHHMSIPCNIHNPILP